MNDPTAPDVVEAARRQRSLLVRRFFETRADSVASLCHEMARRFARGGRLIAFGTGAAATDAQHISVEFVHPVIVGKRALPALALPNDTASSLGLAAADPVAYIARQLEVVVASDDMAVGIMHDRSDAAVAAGLQRARSLGLLTCALTASDAPPIEVDHLFSVECDDPFIVQEIHETLYHVLWELVHVFFEHKGLLDGRRETRSHETGESSFLYPFLQEAESDLGAVLADVARSVVQKANDVASMREAAVDVGVLAATADAMARRIERGGKVIAFGNGGSATDAQDFVTDLVAPPSTFASVPAIALTNDAAVTTAIANDIGYDNVFSRQVIAHGHEADIAVAFSTSGGSRNVLEAIDEARRRGLLTVAFSGYGGGRLMDMCDHAHVVDADYIPRIQEVQVTQYHLLRMLLGQ